MFMKIEINLTKTGPWLRPVITVGQFIRSPEFSLLTSVHSVLCRTNCKVYVCSVLWIYIPGLSLKSLTYLLFMKHKIILLQKHVSHHVYIISIRT